MSVYGKTHPAKRHSAALTDGVDRAPARAMLKGVGFTDADLAKPLIGVATTWIETMPCNLNHRRLAGYVKQGIRRAGGTPIEFNTIAVSDGVSMGTSGMRASLVSREVIADSIELVARGHLFDGLVVHRRLRQDDSRRRDGARAARPAGARALQRLDRGGPVSRRRRHDPGRLRSGRRARRRHDLRRGGARARERRLPGRRRLRRALHREHDGDGARLPRRQRAGPERDPGEPSGQAAGSGARGRARDAARRGGHAAVAGPDARGVRERDRRDRRHRRLDQRRAAPAGDRRRGRHPARDRRLRHDLVAHADRRGHQAGRPLRRDRSLQGRAASRSSRASSCARQFVHEDARAVDGRSLRQVADGVHERPGRTSSSRGTRR